MTITVLYQRCPPRYMKLHALRKLLRMGFGNVFWLVVQARVSLRDDDRLVFSRCLYLRTEWLLFHSISSHHAVSSTACSSRASFAVLLRESGNDLDIATDICSRSCCALGLVNQHRVHSIVNGLLLGRPTRRKPFLLWPRCVSHGRNTMMMPYVRRGPTPTRRCASGFILNNSDLKLFWLPKSKKTSYVANAY